ncbi:hypothetical protein GH5_06787 [Leishmania sp. Ghana 2012 LV757]|uniref:hypothetical protein n=1 Tax=Leishmania sp. Ghana 2012 LV757 TaxID=2803181 RepID=UPI001B70FA19|nr:hypothetical protein GH5_06787 [Leishmania sp. Ghana 2012 LV757]
MAVATPAASAGVPLASTRSPCTLFATESEAYFCLSCNVRCSGLALLVGPHTNHDYLPVSDAVLYLPSALLRETREVVREVEEGFTKPWRVQDQQREGTLLHLLGLRRSKLAAVAQLMAELREVDHQLLHVTETKALDVANWRYQLRGLHRKMEKLHRGATALSTCFAPASSPMGNDTTGVDAGESQGAATSCPPWPHTQHVAQKELAQVCQVLQVQLAQLEEEEYASAQRLEAWHRLLSEVPWGSNASDTLSNAADSTGGENGGTQHVTPSTAAPGAAAAGAIQTPAHEPSLQPRSYYSESWHAPEIAAADAPCTSTPSAPQRQRQQQTSSLSPSPEADTAAAVRRPLHPSDAEVVLLQHALHNINGALRQRLLHAAAASLSSSSSSRSPPTSHHAFSREAADTGITISGLPPLPDATPLRSIQDLTKSASTTSEAAAAGAQQGSTHTSERLTGCASVAAAVHATQSAKGRQQETSPLSRSAEATPPATPAEAEAAGTVLDAAEQEEEEAQRRVWWQSLRAREQEMKNSLNQLLHSVATASSTPPLREHDSVYITDVAGRPAASAISSSIPAYQRGLESR